MSRTYRNKNIVYSWLDDRDGKPFHKPPKIFKQIKKAQRRAKEKDALRHGKEPPKFRHTDEWEYN